MMDCFEEANLKVHIPEVNFTEYLLQSGVISLEDMEIARKQSSRTGQTTPGYLDGVRSDQFPEVRRKPGCLSGIAFDGSCRLEDLQAIPDIPLTVKFIRQHKILPLSMQDGQMTVAMAHPMDLMVLETIRRTTGLSISVTVADFAEIDRRIEDLYGSGSSSMKMILDDLRDEELEILGSEEDQDVDTLA